jgi:hypothetical protein
MIQQPIAALRASAPPLRVLAPLLLAVLVAAIGAGSAQAAAGRSNGPVASAHAIVADVEEESEEEAEEAEEEEEVELEFEEGEEAEEEGALPPECRLRTAAPRVVAHFGRGDMRLTLRYTSESVLRVGVSFWLKGLRGTLQLGSTTRRIGRRGTIALSRHLDERAALKLRAARTIVVQLTVPRAPRSCRRYLTMRLAPVRPLGGGATWYEPT